MNYKLSANGYAELGMYEGVSTQVYLDSVGVRTVSVGLTVSDIHDIASWPWTKVITLQEAFNLYIQAVQKYVRGVNNALRVPVTQNQFDALVAITYNIGVVGMTNSTFMARLNQNKRPEMVVMAMKSWNQGTINGKKKVIKGLVNRRQAEADLFMNGTYKSNGKMTYISVNPATHKPEYSGKPIDVREYFEEIDEHLDR